MSEMLSADQVAAMGGRHRLTRSLNAMTRGDTICRECLCAWPCTVAQLLAQDARWRALVGALLPHVRHAAGCDLALPACQCGAHTAIARGLAALAGAPDASA